MNLCWVFSDGRKGHEIQSMTVANALTTDVELYTFTLRQPWLTFAPRRLPQFDKAIKWSSTPPIEQPPELIITTGRKAAAVGKHYKSLFRLNAVDCKHIQILNPKDSLKKYDWVLLPEHDNIKGKNIINFKGSIHPYDEHWFTQNKDSSYSHYLAVFLGNPPKKYFNKQFKEEILTIRSCFKNSPLYFCGSPRLDKNIRTKIRQTAIPSDKVWLSYDDGANPYQTLLKNAKKIFVTSDSINMINEACASHVSVSILANNLLPSPKHQRFINTMSDRICDLSDNRTHSLKKTYRHSITNLLARIYPDDDI